MARVIYCQLYNEICTRRWCKENPRCCGWFGYETHRTDVDSKEDADVLIAKGKVRARRKSIETAIHLLESEEKTLKELG